jgi:voltage-gated potassium channel
MSKDRAAYPDPSPRAGRRVALLSIARSVLVSAAVFLGYALLPLSRPVDLVTVLWLAGGLLTVAALVVWDLREIARSDHPRLRAVEMLATVVPLFLLLFSSVYFLMEQADAGSFSTPLTRVDAVYLSVTIVSTVGFGDITPVTQAARIVVTAQMLANLVLVGLVARVLLGAVQEGLRRQGRVPRQDVRNPDRSDEERSERPAG